MVVPCPELVSGVKQGGIGRDTGKCGIVRRGRRLFSEEKVRQSERETVRVCVARATDFQIVLAFRIKTK